MEHREQRKRNSDSLRDLGTVLQQQSVSSDTIQHSDKLRSCAYCLFPPYHNGERYTCLTLHLVFISFLLLRDFYVVLTRFVLVLVKRVVLITYLYIYNIGLIVYIFNDILLTTFLLN